MWRPSLSRYLLAVACTLLAFALFLAAIRS
jgi:hypothetical protein